MKDSIDLNHPIAVVGMECCYPGAGNYHEYWQTILDGDVFIKEITDPDTGIPQIYDSDPKAYNKSNSNLGALVDDFEFPYKEFVGLPPVTVNILNKMNRLSLLVAKKAIDNSNITKSSKTNSKTYVVIANKEYDGQLPSYADSSLYYRLRYLKKTKSFLKLSKEKQDRFIRVLHNDYFKLKEKHSVDDLIHATAPSLASRISKLYNFEGGFTAVDSACASSFSAMDFAVKKLRANTSDVAVVGGIGRIVSMLYVYCSKALTMSNKGSNPFDENASGFVAGEGVGFVVLKRLEDAIKNGDNIHGVIRGISPSSDGSQTGPWAPSRHGQKLAIQRAIKQTDYALKDVQYVECHGTGTQVGDLEEVLGLAELFQEEKGRKHLVAIGSSKGGIGHLLTGAGMAGFFRTILAIKNKTLPQTAGLRKINSKLPLKDNNLYIPKKPKKWELPDDIPVRRAMVNCFGFGGTNYNLQLEEYNSEFHQKFLREKEKRYFKKRVNYHQINPSNLHEVFNSPIAITGMAFNIPGSSNYKELIMNLENKKSFITKMDSSRWDMFIGQLKDQNKWSASNDVGGFVDLPDKKDTFRWKIPPSSLEHIDPNQFRLFLAVEDALKQSGLINKKEILKNTSMLCGVNSDSDFMMKEISSLRFNFFKYFIEQQVDFLELDSKQQICEEFLEVIKKDLIEYNADNSVSGVDSMLGSRVAKFFDIKGGSTSINSLCSTGMISLDHACNSLRTNDLDAAVVCASNMAMSGPVFCMHSDLEMMSPDGKLRPFDKHRNGIVLGEGAVVFVLRRLEDALENNENILALIHNINLSNEGISNQMITTHKNTAKLCFDRCVSEMGSKPPVEYVECHGVGLGVGDRIEIESSHEVYGQKHIVIGSIKSSVGHLRVASSLVSLVKAVATVKESRIFPTIGMESPDEYLVDNKQYIHVAETIENFKEKIPYVAVSSIGVSGICGHMIISKFDKEMWKTKKNNYPLLIKGSKEQRAKVLLQVYRSVFEQNEWLKERLPKNILARQKKTLSNLNVYTPQIYMDELKCLAEVLDIDVSTLMELNALSSIVTINYGECMGLAINRFNLMVHAANYDFPFLNKEDNERVSRFLLEFQAPDKISFMGLFHAGSIFPLAGMNKSGIAVTYASSSAPIELGIGININVFIRIVLEECSSLKDVKKMLKEYRFEGCWIIIFSSGREDDSFMVEVAKDQQRIIEGNEKLHTNHFQHLTDEIGASKDSIIRLDRLNKLNFDKVSVFDILGDRFDNERERVTKFSTKNTLNRYNTGASIIFDHENIKINISCQKIPAGDGPYQNYEFNIIEKIDRTKESLFRWIPKSVEVFRSIEQNLSGQSVLFILPERNNYIDYLDGFRDLIQERDFDFIHIGDTFYPRWSYDYVVDIAAFTSNIHKVFEYDFDSFLNMVVFYKKFYQKIHIKNKIISCGFKQGQSLDPLGESLRAYYYSLVMDNNYPLSTHVILPLGLGVKRFFENVYKCLESTNLPSLLDLDGKDFFIKKYLLNYNIDTQNKWNPSDKDVYLITGGGRGITAEIGISLAKKYGGKFIIIGKSKLPSLVFSISKSEFLKKSMIDNPDLRPKEHADLYNQHSRKLEVAKNIQRYQEAGVEIYYESLDLLSDNVKEGITAIIDKYGEIDHIIHGAGIERSKKFFEKNIDEFRKIYFSKTAVTLNVLSQLQKMPLKTIVLFSSTSGINGNVGQTDYSAANAVHFCLPNLLQKEFPDTYIKVIAWPAWGETGMAMNDSVRSMMASSDINFISVKDGTGFFDREFVNRGDDLSVICTSSEDGPTTNFNFYQNSYERKLIQNNIDRILELQYIDLVVSWSEDSLVTIKKFRSADKFMKDHIIEGVPTVPGVVLVETILENLVLWTNEDIQNICIEEISFISPTNIPDHIQDQNVEMIVELSKSDKKIEFKTSIPLLRRDGVVLNKKHVTCRGIARIRISSKSNSPLFPLENCQKLELNPLREKNDFYEILHDRFPEKLGESFQTLEKVLYRDKTSILASVIVEDKKAFGDGIIYFNGGVLDVINQLMVENELLTSKEQTFIPGNYHQINFIESFNIQKKYYVYLWDISFSENKIIFKAAVYDEKRQVAIFIDHMEHIKYKKR